MAFLNYRGDNVVPRPNYVSNFLSHYDTRNA